MPSFLKKSNNIVLWVLDINFILCPYEITYIT